MHSYQIAYLETLIPEMWHNSGSDCNVVDNLQGVKRFIDPDESLGREGRTTRVLGARYFGPRIIREEFPLSIHLSLSLSLAVSPIAFPHPPTRLDSCALCVSSHHQPPTTMTILAPVHVEGSGCQSVRAVALGFEVTWVFVMPDCKFNDET